MSASPADVSVVIPLFNGRDLIASCLASIPEDVEVVVVDDCSTDGAADIIRERFPRARIIQNLENLGFGTTANRGLAACHGRVRVVLNSDARLGACALEKLVAAFDDASVGVAGPRLVFADGSHQISAARFPTLGSIVAGSFLLNDAFRRLMRNRRFPLELGMARHDHDQDHEVDWVKGACIALRDRCLDDIGGFDAAYFMYAEETDLCWRARQHSWRVRYVAGATVVHLGGGSTGDPTIHAQRMVRSEAEFMRRAYGPSILRRWRWARIGGAVLKIPLLGVAGLFDQRARARLRWQVSAAKTAYQLRRTRTQP